jgi:hypothetical protein
MDSSRLLVLLSEAKAQKSPLPGTFFIELIQGFPNHHFSSPPAPLHCMERGEKAPSPLRERGDLEVRTKRLNQFIHNVMTTEKMILSVMEHNLSHDATR